VTAATGLDATPATAWVTAATGLDATPATAWVTPATGPDVGACGALAAVGEAVDTPWVTVETGAETAFEAGPAMADTGFFPVG
jgi:hypothetical protein